MLFFLEIFKARKLGMGFLEGLTCGPRVFWVLIVAPIRYPRHLKSGDMLKR